MLKAQSNSQFSEVSSARGHQFPRVSEKPNVFERASVRVRSGNSRRKSKCEENETEEVKFAPALQTNNPNLRAVIDNTRIYAE